MAYKLVSGLESLHEITEAERPDQHRREISNEKISFRLIPALIYL